MRDRGLTLPAARNTGGRAGLGNDWRVCEEIAVATCFVRMAGLFVPMIVAVLVIVAILAYVALLVAAVEIVGVSVMGGRSVARLC